MPEPLTFSVVTPSYNQGRFIERTILSILDQETACHVEYIVADGGSADETLNILEKYADKLSYTSGPDLGMADALNKGFARASGEILSWLNSDDVYLPGTLQKVADYFVSHPGCLWLYGNCRMIDEEDREVRRWITAYKNRKARRYKYGRLLTENFISQPAVFMRREALELAGPIDTGLPTAMDYDLWLRMGKLGTPGYIGDDLACFRVHGESISAKNYKRQFGEQYRIHKKYDRNAYRLFLHRVRNRLIVLIYAVIH